MINVLDTYECTYILRINYIGFMAYIYDNRPNIVPITYHFNPDENTIIGYSGIGQKIKALRNNSAVSLEVAEINSASNWKSVLVHGKYRELIGSAAKINLHKFSEGVKQIIKTKEKKYMSHISDFSSKIYKEGPPIVFKIEIDELIGREREY